MSGMEEASTVIQVVFRDKISHAFFVRKKMSRKFDI